MPVLYGVFLYMGASSLKGIQVIEDTGSVERETAIISGITHEISF